jgi:hypothetical protein
MPSKLAPRTLRQVADESEKEENARKELGRTRHPEHRDVRVGEGDPLEEEEVEQGQRDRGEVDGSLAHRRARPLLPPCQEAPAKEEGQEHALGRPCPRKEVLRVQPLRHEQELAGEEGVVQVEDGGPEKADPDEQEGGLLPAVEADQGEPSHDESHERSQALQQCVETRRALPGRVPQERGAQADHGQQAPIPDHPLPAPIGSRELSLHGPHRLDRGSPGVRIGG